MGEYVAVSWFAGNVLFYWVHASAHTCEVEVLRCTPVTARYPKLQCSTQEHFANEA